MRIRFTIFALAFATIFILASCGGLFGLSKSDSKEAKGSSADISQILNDIPPEDSLAEKAKDIIAKTKEAVKNADKPITDSTFFKLDQLDSLVQNPDTARQHLFDINKIDSINKPQINPLDTLDSLHAAIYLRNKAIDDSIRLDSAYRRRKNGIDAPVTYVASDSMIYFGGSKTAHLYGKSNVKYTDMDLTSEKIYMSLDSSLVHATGAYDTTKKEKFGTPIFKMGNDTYESDTMAFNFKSKKGLIQNVYTEQDDAFMTSEKSKRDSEGNIYMRHGRYTTCDDDDPDFYIALSRAKVRPGKDVVFGPAYLVVQDVPMPLAIPYGFFPFSKSYSSGFIMPTYGDETSRGFYLRDGGYYFAISDRMDLKLLGEIFTKGSWGFSAASNYRKRYKHSGSFYFSYQDSREGDKGIDQTKTTSFKLQWTHRQDSKANPYSSLSASVNYASTSYESNNMTSLYNPQSRTQSTRTSSVSWSTQFSSIGLSLSTTTNIAQNMRDSTVSLTLPDLNLSLSRFYPFKRKHVAGKERWYEKISMSYTGHISNSITTKEDQLLKSSLVKDWRNGWQHSVPVSASFTLFKYININPSFNFTDKMYTYKVKQDWDTLKQQVVRDTIYGFNNVYNWNMSVSATTKVYGMFIPNRKIFGDKLQAVRHVITPTVSFSYAPDFSSSRYGFYGTYTKTDSKGNVTQVPYSYYDGTLYGGAPSGKTGSLNFSLSNNVEAKIKDKNDSIKKISIIDELGMSMSYNMAAKTHPLSDLTMNIRLKWWKNYTFSTTAVFATYAYELDEDGKPYVGNRTEYSYGRFGRYQGMSQNISYTLTPDKILKLFGGGDDEDKKDDKDKKGDDEDIDVDTNLDDTMEEGKHGAKKESAGKAETDDDGYMKFSMPWSLTFSYGITMRENTSGTFNTSSMRYPYMFTQNLNFSGNVRLSDGWNISFSSGYDFDYHKLSMTTASLSRDLHCFNMSCSVVLSPYTSYNFSFRCNAATLTDALKYDKRSSYSSNIQWY